MVRSALGLMLRYRFRSCAKNWLLTPVLHRAQPAMTASHGPEPGTARCASGQESVEHGVLLYICQGINRPAMLVKGKQVGQTVYR